MKDRARELRRNQTEAERILWQHLRDRRLLGHKFRRQMPIPPYIADFACVELKLIVELDGSQHADQQEYDAQRTAYLEAHGYQVLRFWNNQVMGDIEGVLRAIAIVLLEGGDSPHP